MVVVEQLSAEFQIELAAELVDAVADVLCLKRDVLVVVESDAHEKTVPFPGKCHVGLPLRFRGRIGHDYILLT